MAFSKGGGGRFGIRTPPSTALLERLRLMSALPPKADMDWHGHDVRFVPKADILPLIRRSDRILGLGHGATAVGECRTSA